jgi:hypothetical protein
MCTLLRHNSADIWQLWHPRGDIFPREFRDILVGPRREEDWVGLPKYSEAGPRHSRNLDPVSIMRQGQNAFHNGMRKRRTQAAISICYRARDLDGDPLGPTSPSLKLHIVASLGSSRYAISSAPLVPDSRRLAYQLITDSKRL